MKLKQINKKIFIGILVVLILLSSFLFFILQNNTSNNNDGSIDLNVVDETTIEVETFRPSEDGKSFESTTIPFSSNKDKIQNDMRKYLQSQLCASESFSNSFDFSLSEFTDGNIYAKVTFSSLNFIDYYEKYPKLSELYPASIGAGDPTGTIPANAQKLFAEAIDKTLKNAGADYVLFYIGNMPLGEKEGIVFGEIPQLILDIWEDDKNSGIEKTHPGQTIDEFFSNSNTPTTELIEEDKYQEEIDVKEETQNNINKNTQEQMEYLRQKYPDGDIPENELPFDVVE